MARHFSSDKEVMVEGGSFLLYNNFHERSRSPPDGYYRLDPRRYYCSWRKIFGIEVEWFREGCVAMLVFFLFTGGRPENVSLMESFVNADIFYEKAYFSNNMKNHWFGRYLDSIIAEKLYSKATIRRNDFTNYRL